MRNFIDLMEAFQASITPQFGRMKEPTDVFKNPTSKEWREIRKDGNQPRGYIVGDDVLVWDSGKMLHYEVREQMNLGDQGIPVMFWGDMRQDIDVEVTDDSKRTIWYHNPAVVRAIILNPYLGRNFKEISVSYFDEAIVGPWDDLDDDDDLNESSRVIDGELTIRRNLSDKALVSMTMASKAKKLRGLVVGEDNYYWDAFYGTHFEAAKQLGVEYDVDDRFWVQDKDGEVVVGWTERFEYGRVLNNAYRRLMQSPILLFDGGGYGEVTGYEILAQLTQ